MGSIAVSDVGSRKLLLLTSSKKGPDSSSRLSSPNADTTAAFDQVILRSIEGTPSALRLSSIPLPGLDEFSSIGGTEQKDEKTLQALLLAVPRAVDGPKLVYGSMAVPASIQQSVPMSLHGLLRVAFSDDLFLLPITAVKSAGRQSALEQVLQSPSLCSVSLPRPVDATRLPHVGPKALDTSTDRRLMIHSAVDALKLGTMSSRCVEAGLLLLNDYLDESHEISQTMEGKGNPRTGDYWHGIMHRREPDAGNASYWFRRVGHHPAMEELAASLMTWMRELQCSSQQIELAQQTVIKSGSWDPDAMIQLSTSALRSPGSNAESTCRIVQFLEMLNLLSWTLAS